MTADRNAVAREFVELILAGDIDAAWSRYGQHLADGMLDWLRSDGFHIGFVGGDCRVADLVPLPQPDVVGVIVEGTNTRAAVRVHFNEHGDPTGVRISEWPLRSAFRNIVISASGDRDARPRLNTLYNGLLGLGPGELRRPVIACGGGNEDPQPRWPDPNFAQQMHLDFLVRDLQVSEWFVLEAGATLLKDQGAFRIYADHVGHPFCLYPDPSPDRAAARVWRVVIDCFSPRSLAAFYEDFLDMRDRVEDSSDFVVIAYEDGRLPMLAFQHAPQYVAPQWPDPRSPQQIHLDLHFEDHAAAQERALRLGAIPLPKGGSCPVYADPAGHPFCLCSPGS